LDLNKIYKDEEGNDVILIGEISKEEIEAKRKQQINEARRVVERLKKVLFENRKIHKKDE
jgi:hypothetical protein